METNSASRKLKEGYDIMAEEIRNDANKTGDEKFIALLWIGRPLYKK